MNNKLYKGDNGEELTAKELWSKCEVKLKPLRDAGVLFRVDQIKIDDVMYRHKEFGKPDSDEELVSLIDKAILNHFKGKKK